MPAKKKQPQLGEPLPLITTYEEWIEKFEDLVVNVEQHIVDYPETEPKLGRIIKEQRRILEILKAPPRAQGEQG